MIKNKKKLLSIILFLVIFLVIPQITNAALVPCATETVDRPCTLCDFIVGFQGLIKYGFTIITILAIVAIFGAGTMYVVSVGDSGMMEKAKSFLKSTLIGFVVVFGGWLIVNLAMLALSAKTDLGLENGRTWWQFSCSTVSSQGQGSGGNVPLGQGGTTVTAQNCCVVGPGQCSHVTSANQCNPGIYKTGACAALSECVAGQACGINNVGECKSGVVSCSSGYTATMGNAGNPCPSGSKCCARNGESAETCRGGFSSTIGKCFYGMNICPSGWSHPLGGLCSASNSVCCIQ